MRLRSGRIISKQIISDVEVAKILLSLKEKNKSSDKKINIKTNKY